MDACVNYLLMDRFFGDAVDEVREGFFDGCIGLTVLDHGDV